MSKKEHGSLSFLLSTGILTAFLVLLFFLSFMIGTYPINAGTVWDVLRSSFMNVTPYWESAVEKVIFQVRIPRILLAVFTGGTLAVSGASYQTLFKNPMVSPDLLGVSAGAGFGAALAMIFDGNWSEKAMPLSGRLKGRPVTEYLDDIFCGNILRRTLGIAALNALSLAVQEQDRNSGYELLSGVDAFDELDVTRYKKTVVVGALVPMLKKLIAANADFHVLEQDPRTLKERELPYYAPANQACRYVPDADLLVITGVTILNDTLPGLLAMAKPGAEILITGPTASMVPEPFFRKGVTMLGGIQVTKPDELLDIISEGGSGYHFFGKYAERTVIRNKEV